MANWFCYLRIYLLSSWKEIKPINAIQEFLLKTVQKIPVKTAAKEAKIKKLTKVFISYDQWIRSVYVSWWTLTKSQRKHEFVFILAIIGSVVLNGKILRSWRKVWKNIATLLKIPNAAWNYVLTSHRHDSYGISGRLMNDNRVPHKSFVMAIFRSKTQNRIHTSVNISIFRCEIH